MQHLSLEEKFERAAGIATHPAESRTWPQFAIILSSDSGYGKRSGRLHEVFRAVEVKAIGTARKLTWLNDYKGYLTVYWNCVPSPADRQIVETVWAYADALIAGAPENCLIKHQLLKWWDI